MPSILIVEDDPALANLYDKVFKDHGFSTLIARDGLAGLETAINKRPNCIIMDMKLPKMTGMEIFEKLQSDTEAKKIPVIFLTNDTDPIEKEKAMKLGAKDYLAKAMFAPEDIVSKVKKYLGLQDN